MAITRSFQWHRHATSDPQNGAAAITGVPDTTIGGAVYGPTRDRYITVDADIGKFIHERELATNQVGPAAAPQISNVIGPIVAAGEVYVPADGTIAPLTGTLYGDRPLQPRILKRTEVGVYDAEVLSMAALHTLIHAATPSTMAVANGLWSNPATWSNGVPVAGMTVHIPTAFDVTYDVESDAQLKYVNVHGKLRWDPSKDTKIVLDTLHTGAGSYLEIGTRFNPIPESATPGKPRAQFVFIGDAPGTSTRLGVMTMGKVSIHGARKPEKVDLQGGINAGQDTFTVKAGVDISSWRVGDTICVLARDYAGFGTDPQYTGPQSYHDRAANPNTYYNYDANGFRKDHSEIRTILTITGQTVKLSSNLAYSHQPQTTTRTLPKAPVTPVDNFTVGQTVTLPARVCNMSRSIRFESGGAPLSDLQKRAHIMFMACDQVDVRYAEAKNMGRTDTDPSLTIPGPKYNPAYPDLYIRNTVYTDDTLTTDLANPNNGIGRYAWHLHGTGLYGDGPRFNRNMCVWEGLTAWAPQGEVPQPGWAMTHHNSRLAMDKCVVYNVRGAAFVSEIGSETGQWLHCTAIWCRGDGYYPSWGGRQREQHNHNGHCGVGFENQSRNVLIQNCEIVSARVGLLYSVQTQLWDNGWGVGKGADYQSLRHFNPIVTANGGADQPDRDTYGKAGSQIPDLNYIDAVNVQQVHRVDHRVEITRGDPTSMICIGWRVFACEEVQHYDNYTYKYFFRDFAYWGAPGGSPGVAFIGTRTSIFGWKNGIIEGYPFAIQPGSQSNFGPGWIDIATNLTTTGDTNTNGQAFKNSSSFPNIQPSWSMKTSIPGYNINVNPGNSNIVFTGTMVDAYSPGGRHWPEFQEPDVANGNPPPTDANAGYAVMAAQNATDGYHQIYLNGCYKSGANYLMPGYYSTVDWGTFKEFIIRVNHPIQGVWEPGFLDANIVVPTPPAIPLVPEDINKPFPSISRPVNTTPPFISGAPIEGMTVELDFGVWTGKPNDCDWPSIQWNLDGSPAAANAVGRTFTLPGGSTGKALTCDLAMYNSGGKSDVITTAAVIVRAPPAMTMATALSGTLAESWLADDPDSSMDIYNPYYVKAPGPCMGSYGALQNWGGNGLPPPNVRGLKPYNSFFYVRERGWAADKSRAFDSARRYRSGYGSMWIDNLLGTGTEPVHVWVVIQRSAEDQQNTSEVLMGFGHSVSVQNAAQDPAQNKLIWNVGGGQQTLSTGFGKNAMGVLYFGRNSQGAKAGFNNTVLTANANLAAFSRLFIVGNNGAAFLVKAVYVGSADTYTSTQMTNAQASLASRHGF